LYFDETGNRKNQRDDLEEEKTTFTTVKKKVKGGSFESFNLSPEVFKAIKKKGYN